MNILVIGGAGFIGSHLVDRLIEDGHKVVVFDNFSTGKLNNLNPMCELIYGDITNKYIIKKATRNIDVVFHLAATWLLNCQEHPNFAFENNVIGTKNVLEACICRNIKRLIFSSSASVYGDAIEEPMTENHPYNNLTIYGATKIANEHLIKAYSHKYNLKSVCLRYFNVYGPRQTLNGAYTSVIPKMIVGVKTGEITVIGSGEQSYDFIYVKDVADANICAMKSKGIFGFYNVCTGVKTSINELTKKIVIATGTKPIIKYVPTIHNLVTNRIGSTELAEDELGFKYSVDLNDGLREFVKEIRYGV